MAAMDTQETQGQLASAASSEVIIELNKVNKWYGDFHVLKDIDLEVRKGERIVVCGPSGSGKSTLIRCINRLEEHQQGDIIVDKKCTVFGKFKIKTKDQTLAREISFGFMSPDKSYFTMVAIEKNGKELNTSFVQRIQN